jgi:hypothetical protein
MVFPDKDLIAVFTAWDILGDWVTNRQLVRRKPSAVGLHACGI